MIYEYALEPELVATWTDRHDYRYFVERFGLGQGRIVSRFPKRWARLVWSSFTGASEIERKRLEELVSRLSERMVRRTGIEWDSNASWLENVEREDWRVAFRAILARANPRAHASVIVAADVDEDSEPRWAAPHGKSVERRAGEMANSVASVLRCSSVVVFVDPHFGPERPRFRRPLEAFLERMVRERPGALPDRIEILTGIKTTGTLEFFRSKCVARLPSCIPKGVHIIIRRLSQGKAREAFHNRYILTDIGGVIFGIGLDDGQEDETDDLNLMARTQYELRWEQFADATSTEFEQDEPSFEVAGIREVT